MRDDADVQQYAPAGTPPHPSAGTPPPVTIPLFEPGERAALRLMDLAPDRLELLLSFGRRRYGERVLRLGDEATWRWLERSDNPYRHEIDAVRRRLGGPGAVLLNMSYEWSCTAGVGADPAGTGSRLLRALDWPLSGLGRSIVVARQQGAAGEYYNVTWPGYVGVLTAMAPGRFSAGLNQPPLRKVTGVLALDWIVGRARVWRQAALPPAHLLRRVFDQCRSYAEAKRMLTETPLCLPAFFALSGIDAGEGCVIERLENAAVVHAAPACISNNWVGMTLAGHNRGNDSPQRREHMARTMPQADDGFDWLKPPVLNARTRLAVVANAARRVLAVQGWEDEAPATQAFSLDDPASRRPAATPGLPTAAPA